jgi:hypothetical protein
VRRQIERFPQKVTPKTALDAVRVDPDDNRILERASAALSDYIVSGDKDLLRLGTYAHADSECFGLSGIGAGGGEVVSSIKSLVDTMRSWSGYKFS